MKRVSIVVSEDDAGTIHIHTTQLGGIKFTVLELLGICDVLRDDVMKAGFALQKAKEESEQPEGKPDTKSRSSVKRTAFSTNKRITSKKRK